MSIGALSSSSSFSPANSEAAMPKTWTDAKIKKVTRVALAAILILAVVAMVAVTVVALCFPIVSPIAMAIGYSCFFIGGIVAGLGAYVLLESSCKIRDFENPEELEQTKKDAKNMTLLELASTYDDSLTSIIHNGVGLCTFSSRKQAGRVFQNLLKYKVLTLEELKDKFTHQLNDLSPSEIVQSYELEDLFASGIAKRDDVENRFRSYRRQVAGQMVDISPKSEIEYVKTEIEKKRKAEENINWGDDIDDEISGFDGLCNMLSPF